MLGTMKIIIFLLFKILFVTSSWIDTPIVELTDGKVMGKLTELENGNKFYEFREIPYATPPIGVLRFQVPIPPKKWYDVRNATENTKICYEGIEHINEQEKKYHNQATKNIKVIQSEDCLYLNVFTPKLPGYINNSLLPVYVYIYGGMFTFGHPFYYNFNSFLQEDIVVVTFNFRSSSLGFLTTADGVIPSNLGLKDQVAALKWISKNIIMFGGDPAKVTIGGHSSGSVCVGFHLLNNQTKGLYRSAIMQSGTPLVSKIYSRDPKQIAFLFGEALSSDFDATKNTSRDLLQLLRNTPADVLVSPVLKKLPEEYYFPILDSRLMWVPYSEDTNYYNAFTSGSIYENFKRGTFNGVPLLMGMVDEEMKDFENIAEAAAILDQNHTYIVNPALNIKQNYTTAYAEELKDIYCKTSLFAHNLTGVVKMISDLHIAMSVKVMADLYSKFADVYFYEFSHSGPINGIDYWKGFKTSNIGGVGKCGHTDELPLLYDYVPMKPVQPPTELDLVVQKRLIKLWSNFIKFSNPTPKKDVLLQNVIWPKVNQQNFEYTNIDASLNIKRNPKYLKEWNRRLRQFYDDPIYCI